MSPPERAARLSRAGARQSAFSRHERTCPEREGPAGRGDRHPADRLAYPQSRGLSGDSLGWHEAAVSAPNVSPVTKPTDRGAMSASRWASIPMNLLSRHQGGLDGTRAGVRKLRGRISTLYFRPTGRDRPRDRPLVQTDPGPETMAPIRTGHQPPTNDLAPESPAKAAEAAPACADGAVTTDVSGGQSWRPGAARRTPGPSPGASSGAPRRPSVASEPIRSPMCVAGLSVSNKKENSCLDSGRNE
jgi:hypothetical protein